jgi:tRNA-splicing ligase RtcB (3'-phosphate/5'-hydroxy nucleic acid ligase)
MKWTQASGLMRIPICSWCNDVDSEAMKQATDLARHPKTVGHVALMPDCHVGYGMPIGGVIACDNAVIPNAVGVDIGCGMCAIQTSLMKAELGDLPDIRELLNQVREYIPLGEGHPHQKPQQWNGFSRYMDKLSSPPPWFSDRTWTLAALNLGSLGGGNHFIEIQHDETDRIWLMLHSGSRNLGYRIAEAYHAQAIKYCQKHELSFPLEQLSYLPADSKPGLDYIRDMNFALEYAMENRARMMRVFKNAFQDNFSDIQFELEINIHHNFAALETFGDGEFWIHRKGATSAKAGQLGIIPGSMGSPSYIVRGLGNPASFNSCSHGAGRIMGRKEACRRLSVEKCDLSMTGIVHDRWKMLRQRKKKKGPRMLDLSEAPQAYKDIEEVIDSQTDLVEPIVRLRPLGVLKG